MKSLIVIVSTLLLVINLVNSAAIKSDVKDSATLEAPGPDGDLNPASTFWPIFIGGGFGWGGGYGGWGPHYGGGWGW